MNDQDGEQKASRIVEFVMLFVRIVSVPVVGATVLMTLHTHIPMSIVIWVAIATWGILTTALLAIPGPKYNMPEAEFRERYGAPEDG